MLGSVAVQTLEFEKDGTLDLEKVKKGIKPDDSHLDDKPYAKRKVTQLRRPGPFYTQARPLLLFHWNFNNI